VCKHLLFFIIDSLKLLYSVVAEDIRRTYTIVCMSQSRTWISNTICVVFVMRGCCSFC
jgi:hypothetical protein